METKLAGKKKMSGWRGPSAPGPRLQSRSKGVKKSASNILLLEGGEGEGGLADGVTLNTKRLDFLYAPVDEKDCAQTTYQLSGDASLGWRGGKGESGERCGRRLSTKERLRKGRGVVEGEESENLGIKSIGFCLPISTKGGKSLPTRVTRGF